MKSRKRNEKSKELVAMFCKMKKKNLIHYKSTLF